MSNTIHHLIVLCDDMCHERLLAALDTGTRVIGICIIGESSCLAHLLEDDAIHSTSEVFVEQYPDSRLFWVPVASLIMIHAHIDILGIIGSQKNLVLVSQLVQIWVVQRNAIQFLGGTVDLFDCCHHTLFIHRTIIEHAVLILPQILEQVDEHLWIGLFQLLFRQDITVGITRTLSTVCIQVFEIGSLTLLGVLATFQCAVNQLIVCFFINLGIQEEILQQ